MDSEVSLKNDSKVSAEPDSAASAAALAILAHSLLAFVTAVPWEEEQSDCKVVADTEATASANIDDWSFMFKGKSVLKDPCSVSPGNELEQKEEGMYRCRMPLGLGADLGPCYSLYKFFDYCPSSSAVDHPIQASQRFGFANGRWKHICTKLSRLVFRDSARVRKRRTFGNAETADRHDMTRATEVQKYSRQRKGLLERGFDPALLRLRAQDDATLPLEKRVIRTREDIQRIIWILYPRIQIRDRSVEAKNCQKCRRNKHEPVENRKQRFSPSGELLASGQEDLLRVRETECEPVWCQLEFRESRSRKRSLTMLQTKQRICPKSY